ncbi:sodium:dicarboxylate symporter [Exiguobacterium sp. U13-1]|uniref:dicarboxylate/amino acid:cation symporter n=1 Tax=Exiguobacterium sp. U13-1 TaxID=1849031 RepID=UPI0008596BE2|nr:dicarboxylate/amino acid:cation symporter [Exiguobacterium sp. U13-1]AOS99961.1 sodium:dicarboxylate symporter [Exiguobacterium sp. U13-1]HBQ76078.1 dicarboxylate/amino acid:cation symporter [Exiguobacterium sp.]
MKEAKRIIWGLILGVILGIVLASLPDKSIYEGLNKYALQPIGTIFLNLIKMLVVPIVFFSIALGVMGLGNPKELGRVGGKAITYFMTTTAVAIVIALGLSLLIKPGTFGNFETQGLEYDNGNLPDTSIINTIVGMFPTNPITSMAEGNMLQIIVFSVFIGFGITFLGQKVSTLRTFIEQGNDLMTYLITLVMKMAPLGAFALIASAVGSQGWDSLKAMGLYMGVVILSLFVHSVLTYGSTVSLLGKMNPFFFFKKFAPVMLFAFSTSSSNATLPVAMQTAQKELKVPRSVSSFVQPLGATINMDGTAIMQGVATVFIAQVYAVDLTAGQLATVVLTAVLASVGTAGVPGVGLVMLTMVLQSVNLPVEGIALIIGVDRLLDMMRTAVNITGDAACAVIVSKSEEGNLKEEENEETDERYA